MSRAGLALAVGATLAYLVFVLPQLNRPLMYDDANFALGIKAAAETGVPFGNQGWMSDRGDFSQREQWALWHPPLYIYTAAIFAKLFGWSAPAMRIVGVVGGLAAALLTYVLARDLTRGPPVMRSFAGGTAVALVMLSPLVVQSTLILDIDFAVLLPLTLLLLWLYVRGTAVYWLAALFGLLLWAKMTNPLPLVGVILVWQVLRGNWRRAIVEAVTIGLGGGALFAVTWVAIGSVLHFPLEMPFSVNAVQWQDSAEVARRAYVSPGAFIDAWQTTVQWIGPGLVALGLAAVAVRGGMLIRCWRIRRADLLIGVVAAFILGYVNKYAGWFPKYEVALVPLLACLAAPLVAHAWCARLRVTLFVAATGTIVAAASAYRLIGDAWALQRTWTIEPSAAVWLVAIVLVGAVAGIAWRAPAVGAAAGLIAIALGWSLALDIRQVRAAYQTDYWYGTTGVAETVAWVNAHIQPNDTYLAAKEIAIASRAQRYVDQDNLVYFVSVGRPFDRIWAGEPLRALVTWQREPYVADLIARQAARTGWRESARFGDYVIYELTDGS